MKTTLYDSAPEKANDRPDLPEGRPDQEMRTYRFLNKAGITFKRADHDRAETMEDCLQIEKVLKAPICKNLFLTNRQQTDFYLLIMPGQKPFKTKLLSKQIGSARLSFASPAQMEQHLDVSPGSASVLGLMNDREGAVRLLVDRDLLSQPYFGCHPCLNTSSLRLSTKALFEQVLPALGHEPLFVELPWEIPEE